jgi:hypothetical protein
MGPIVPSPLIFLTLDGGRVRLLTLGIAPCGAGRGHATSGSETSRPPFKAPNASWTLGRRPPDASLLLCLKRPLLSYLVAHN